MTYKDKDKQKTAQRERTRRYRAKQKGVTSKGVTEGVTPETTETAPTTQNTDEQEGAQCVKSEGAEQFIGLKEPILITDVTPEDQAAVFETLPPEPTRPTGHTTPATANMTTRQLKTRLSLYHGLDWINSPEYAETIYRLLTRTLDDLKDAGQSIPAWRQSEAA